MTDSTVGLPTLRSSDVTIIIVNFNAGDELLRCLEAVRQQTLPPSRVLVVDNASTDGSLEKAANYYPEYEFVLLESNTGFAKANNLAIASCTTAYVALLNPDAFPEPGWLQALVSAAEGSAAEVAAFGSCQLMTGSGSVIDGIGDACHVSGLVWRVGHGKPMAEVNLVSREIFSACAAAALYRRDWLKAVGGFDEDFFCYVEDVDLGFRLRLAGARAWFVSDAIVRHHGSMTSGGKRSDFSVYHGHRNMVWLFVKNMPGYLFWLMLPLHIAMNFLSTLIFSCRGQTKTILRAKKDAILGLGNAWAKRSTIQKNRVITAQMMMSALNCDALPRRERQ